MTSRAAAGRSAGAQAGAADRKVDSEGRSGGGQSAGPCAIFLGTRRITRWADARPRQVGATPDRDWGLANLPPAWRLRAGSVQPHTTSTATQRMALRAPTDSCLHPSAACAHAAICDLVDQGAVEDCEPAKLPVYAVWPASKIIAEKIRLFVALLASRLKRAPL